MDIVLRRNEGHIVVSMSGRFVFDCHRDFRSVMCRSLQEASTEVHFDLGGIDYVDSAALGMLQVLSDKARAAGKRVVLRNSQGNIRALLGIAGIDRLLPVA